MPKEYTEINLNAQIKVRLTKLGHDTYRQWLHSLRYDLESNIKEDEHGYSTWQLWRFMQIFGPHMGMGLPHVCDMTIKIQK